MYTDTSVVAIRPFFEGYEGSFLIAFRLRPSFGVLEIFPDLRPDVKRFHGLSHIAQRSLHDGLAQFVVGLREIVGGNLLENTLWFVSPTVVYDTSRITRVRYQKRHDGQQ